MSTDLIRSIQEKQEDAMIGIYILTEEHFRVAVEVIDGHSTDVYVTVRVVAKLDIQRPARLDVGEELHVLPSKLTPLNAEVLRELIELHVQEELATANAPHVRC